MTKKNNDINKPKHFVFYHKFINIFFFFFCSALTTNIIAKKIAAMLWNDNIVLLSSVTTLQNHSFTETSKLRIIIHCCSINNTAESICTD